MMEVRKLGFLQVIPLLITIFFLSFPAYGKYSGGTGEPNDAYQIATAEDLMLLGESTEDYDKHFILIDDIDLDPNLPGRKVFDRAIISSLFAPFTGVFDGNGHVISNLNIQHRGQGIQFNSPINFGLFGQLQSEAEVKNLGVDDVNINISIGGNDYYMVGGIAGVNFGNVIQCHSTGSVSGGEFVGGLVGNNSGDVTVCYSTCAVTGIRLPLEFTVWPVWPVWPGERSVEGCEGGVGGLVGYNTGSIDMSYSTGAVSGNGCVGGLVGANGSYPTIYLPTPILPIEPNLPLDPIFPVDPNFPIGPIFPIDPNFIVDPGFYLGFEVIGLRGWIINCYATGSITGVNRFGGLVGQNIFGEIVASFWDIETSGVTSSNAGAGKTTAEMQTASTFLEAGWDFAGETENGTEDIWWIDEGQGYPRLWWQYGLAFSPYPQDGAIDVSQPVILKWLPGGSGLYHDVYFGEDEEAVANATTENPDVYCGQLPMEVAAYNPGKLEFKKTYYWRIDEVNQDDPNSLWRGDVWSFTTNEFIVVDDFEAYDDLYNKMFYTWEDGYGHSGDASNAVEPFAGNNTGSFVGFLYPLFNEQTIVHGGSQSMPFHYDNDGKVFDGTSDEKSGTLYYSEATANVDNLLIGRDWTIEGFGLLSLWFRGDPSNAPETMYVVLNGIAGVDNDNPNAAQMNSWTQWDIVLQEFIEQGVDLTNVNTITLGFGNRSNPVSGGSGLVYFDDIRLYRPSLIIVPEPPPDWPWPYPIDPITPPPWPWPDPIEPVIPSPIRPWSVPTEPKL